MLSHIWKFDKYLLRVLISYLRCLKWAPRGNVSAIELHIDFSAFRFIKSGDKERVPATFAKNSVAGGAREMKKYITHLKKNCKKLKLPPPVPAEEGKFNSLRSIGGPARVMGYNRRPIFVAHGYTARVLEKQLSKAKQTTCNWGGDVPLSFLPTLNNWDFKKSHQKKGRLRLANSKPLSGRVVSHTFHFQASIFFIILGKPGE